MSSRLAATDKTIANRAPLTVAQAEHFLCVSSSRQQQHHPAASFAGRRHAKERRRHLPATDTKLAAHLTSRVAQTNGVKIGGTAAAVGATCCRPPNSLIACLRAARARELCRQQGVTLKPPAHLQRTSSGARGRARERGERELASGQLILAQANEQAASFRRVLARKCSEPDCVASESWSTPILRW